MDKDKNNKKDKDDAVEKNLPGRKDDDAAGKDTPERKDDSSIIDDVTSGDYKYGFVTDVDTEVIPVGLSEDVVRLISKKKNEPEWLLEFRLKAYRHWLTMTPPKWGHLDMPDIDFQAISYYAAPVKKDGPKDLDEIDPEVLKTFDRLGIPLQEQKMLSGMAVDAVMDSVSVKTTHREALAEKGIIFCSISEAVKDYPDLVKKYLGSVVSYKDNFYAALNSAVFSDGSFVYIPKGVRCPMELSTYFRINAAGTGQFERTLIVADDDSYVSYLEGCTAPYARREPAPRRHRGDCRGGEGRGEILHGAELVCRRRRGARRCLQPCDQARPLPWRLLQALLDPGGDRVGHHLEIPLLCAGRARLVG